MASKARTARLITAVNRQLLGRSDLPKTRTGSRLKGFTAPGVSKFIDNNQQSVKSAENLGRAGFNRLANRFIREHARKKKKRKS